MLVYRYEDSNGVGPYQNPTIKLRSLVPTPQAEGMSFYTGCRSAFCSLDSMDCWFSNKEQDDMEDAGYVLVAYEADRHHIQTSARQVVFDINFAVCMGEV